MPVQSGHHRGIELAGSDFSDYVRAAERNRELVTWLAHWRSEHGLSQDQVAKRMHTSQPAVARLESHQHDAQLSTLARYITALGLSMNVTLTDRMTGEEIWTSVEEPEVDELAEGAQPTGQPGHSEMKPWQNQRAGPPYLIAIGYPDETTADAAADEAPAGSDFSDYVRAAERNRELVTWLAHWRSEHGLSQDQVAKRMHTSQPAVARLESHQHDAQLSTLARYITALGLSMNVTLTDRMTGEEIWTSVEEPEVDELAEGAQPTGQPGHSEMKPWQNQRAGPPYLIAIGYPDETTAEEAAEEARRLAKDLIIEPEAIAVIARDAKGDYHVHTQHHLVGRGATWGMFWGLLFGLLFFVPVFGIAIGAGMGALMGKVTKSGVDKEFQDQVRGMLQPGTSALFLMVEKVTPDKAIEALSKYGGTVLMTSLSKEGEQELQEALHGGSLA